MIIRLFSIFDPCTLLFKEISWIVILIGMLIIPLKIYLVNNYYMKLINNFINYLINEFFAILKKNSIILLIIIITFTVVILNNVLGLFPYIFNRTSSLRVSLTLSLIMWLSGYVIIIIFNFSNILVHLIPQGTSLILIPFIVIIEIISLIIRPITLAIRLRANIIAGHLLISLVRNSIENDNLILFFSGALGQRLLTLLETAVAVIQSYVFLVLIVLYSVDSLA